MLSSDCPSRKLKMLTILFRGAVWWVGGMFLSAIKCLVQAIKCQERNTMKSLYLYAGVGLDEFYVEYGHIEGGNIPVNVWHTSGLP